MIPVGGDFLVFEIEEGIDAVYEELRARGVEFRGALQQEPFGRIGEFGGPSRKH